MNDIDHLIKIIKETLDYESESFYFDLREKGIIDVVKFNIITDACFDLHNKDLTKIQRFEIAVVLWELAFHTKTLISSHYNKTDLFKIKNSTEDNLRQINSILFYICNWFTYAKPMDKESLKIGSW